MQLPRLPLQISERKTLLVLIDILLINGAVLVALWLWTLRDPRRSFSQEFILSQAHWFFFLTALWLLVAALNDFYTLKVTSDVMSSVLTLVRLTALMLVVYLGIYFASPRHALPRLFILYFGAAAFILLGIGRISYAFLFSRAPFRRRAVIVGAGWAGRTIAKAIYENLSSVYHLLGYIDDDPTKQSQIIEGLPVLGTRRYLPDLVRDNSISEVILAVTHDVDGELLQILMDCQELGAQISPMPVLYEKITGRVPVEHIGDAWYVALPLEYPSAGGFFPLFKRSIDIVIALFGLLLFAPLFPFIAFFLYLDSPGPLFYTQQRVGRGGQIYRVIKLRTMVKDAEKGGAVWAQENDPRVTRVGRILRKTRLDELPQFINVLKGEMSIVGPRPERPEFVAELEQQIPFYRVRHCVKPGMAGWALIHAGYASSVEDALIKLQYDLYYIKHQSLGLDAIILLKALAGMLSFRGR